MYSASWRIMCLYMWVHCEFCGEIPSITNFSAANNLDFILILWIANQDFLDSTLTLQLIFCGYAHKLHQNHVHPLSYFFRGENPVFHLLTTWSVHDFMSSYSLDANVSLQFSDYEGLEGSDASVMVCSELTAGILERGVTVDLSTSDITAIAGKDTWLTYG